MSEHSVSGSDCVSCGGLTNHRLLPLAPLARTEAKYWLRFCCAGVLAIGMPAQTDGGRQTGTTLTRLAGRGV